MDSLPPEDAQYFDSIDEIPSTGRLSISPLRKPPTLTGGLIALDLEQQSGDADSDDDFTLTKPASFASPRPKKSFELNKSLELNKNPASGFKFGVRGLTTTPNQFSRNPSKPSPLRQSEVHPKSALGVGPVPGRQVAGTRLRAKGVVSDLSNSESQGQAPKTPTTRQPLNNLNNNGLLNRSNAKTPVENAVSKAAQVPPFLSPTVQVQLRVKSPVSRQPTVQDLPFHMENAQTNTTALRAVSPVNLNTLVRSVQPQEPHQQRQYQLRDQHEDDYRHQQGENHHDQYQDAGKDNHQFQLGDREQDHAQEQNRDQRQDAPQENHQGRCQTHQQHQRQDQHRLDHDEGVQVPQASPPPRAPLLNMATKDRTGSRLYVSTKKLTGGSKIAPPAKYLKTYGRNQDGEMSGLLEPSPPHQNVQTTARASSHLVARNQGVHDHGQKISRQPSYNNSQSSILSSDNVSPSPGHQQQNAKAATNFTSSMAGIINQYNKTQRSALDKQRVHYKKQIKTLERELAKSAEATTHYRGRSEAKSKELKELQAASDNMAAKITELEIKLDASEMLPNQLNQRIQELEQKLEDSRCANVLQADKIHEFRASFNQAVIEQQDLYVRSKTHCDETIKELQEIVVMKQAAAEKAIQNAEAIRDDMMQRFRQGIAQHKVEALELGHQIETLTQQIEGKDMVLIQQKETIRDLSEKVNDLETSSHSFESLATQNQELLRQIDHHGSQAQKQSEACAKETWNRLASVSNSLDTLAKSLSDQPRVISSIQEVQTRELGSIATKLDAILQTRESAKEVTKQLSTELDTQMGKIWERLDNQIETLSQQLAQKAEENGMLSALCKEKEMTYERLEQDMEELQKASAEQIEKIQALREREQEYHLAMEAAREDDQQHTQELTERLKASEAETSRLTEQLKLKMESMTNLGEQMKVKEEEFGNGLRSFSAEILKLNQVIENKDRAAQDAIARATEMAAREVHVKMEETLAETQQHIRQRDEHIKGLQTQLGELKRSLHDKEQNQRRDACSLSSLRETLSTAQLKEKELSEKLTTQSAKFNELEGQLRSRMDIVNAELEATKRRVIEYEREIEAAKEKAEKFERESRNQRARAQALFSAVKDWAHKGGFETASFDEICGEKKSAEEVGSGLSQALAQLGLSQRVQVNYHRRDDLLLDGNEPHFNNTNRELPVLLSQESYFGNTSEQPQEVLALIHSRRVVVRSPANDRDTPIPPSVSEEKVRRREGAQPKSIMKTTVARVTRSTTLAAQDPNAPEATNGDRMRNSHLNGDLMASSPDPLISNAAETSELYALSPHLPMTGRTQSAGQNKRKQPDDPGPDIFVTRQRKPKTSKMTEDIETETLAQLEELVGAKKRPAKKKVVRTYGTQKPLETFHEDGSASNALQLLHPDSQAQSRLSSQQRQSPGSSKLKESQESSDNSQDSIETVGVHSEVSMEGGGSSTRLPPLRRNARK